MPILDKGVHERSPSESQNKGSEERGGGLTEFMKQEETIVQVQTGCDNSPEALGQLSYRSTEGIQEVLT